MNRAPGTGGGMAERAGSDFLVRFASTVVLAALALAAAWSGGWPATLVVAVAVAVVHLEWLGLTETPARATALLITVAVVVSVLLVAEGPTSIGFGLLGLTVAAAAITGRDLWRPLGVVYAAALGTGLVVLRFAPDLGLAAIAVLLAVVWASDTGAFFAGRAIGGPKLWPRVSPNKTWAGAIGGLAAGIAAGLLVAALFQIRVGLGLATIVAALGIAAQAGDLFESGVKRRFGAKDSGWLIPGHGGLMDRVDGLTFAAALAAFIGWLAGGSTDIARGLLQW